MDPGDDATASPAHTTVVGSGRSGQVQLVALGPDESVVACDLPAEGAITIGRGGCSDVELPDPRVSRQHARLHVGAGPTFAIEDLGSANGTQVGRERLATGERQSVEVGEAIFIGSTVALIQPAPARRAPPATPTRRVAQEALAGACQRAAVEGGSFVVALVDLLDGFQRQPVEELLARQVLLEVRELAEYAALLPEGSPVLAALARLPGVAIGQAVYPADGATAERLLAEARTRVDAAALRVPGAEQLVFCDPRMRRLHDLARRAAAGLVNVLLLGETGVGKDVMARAIHRASPRARKPLQRVECAALTEALAESELFGHERGAFTGALAAKAGLIEAADGGTVLLDEVGDLPPRLQGKLLHLLETRQSTRVGAVQGRGVDVRFIAATNRDLEDDVARGLFRKDLFYRLDGFTITIPPLRERPADVLSLARAFLRESCRQLGRTVPALASETARQLERHRWPGNLRELRNVVDRAVLVCDGPAILPEHLALSTGPDEEPPLSPTDGQEKQRIETALAACGGNQSRAAKLLGMARSTLVLRLDALRVRRPRKPART
jgi:two-component system response regulator AtoC